MIREPVHLTHESIADCFQRVGFDPPWIILQNTFARLETALQTRRCSLSGSTANQNHDIYALIPDYPHSDMIPPTDVHVQVTPEAPPQCPERHRTFQQAGILKRHLRQQHSYNYPIKDLRGWRHER